MDGRTVITIGREFGSGGHEIGMKLAERLGIKCYDKELLELAAKESGLCEELFASQDEKPTNSFLYSLVMDTYSLGYSNSYVDMPINHKVFLAQFDAIKKLAEKESCVIVGRCADYALEDDPFGLRQVLMKELRELRSYMSLMIQRLLTLSRRRIRREQVTTITIQARSGAKLRATTYVSTVVLLE